MMENKKITHIDWKAIEEKLGNYLTADKVCFILGISDEVLREYLGIKDGSYIHDKEEKKEDDFFTSICSSITQRIADAKEIAEKNGNECGLSYLVGCFDLTTNSIRNYIQTHQEEYKEDRFTK